MFEIKPLGYDFNALKPVLGKDTLFFHHEKHYAGYVSKTNELLPKKWQGKTLEQVVQLSQKQGNVALFNQVAQAWNHEFFFAGLSVKPDDKEISGALLDLIKNDYQNTENLKLELVKTALARFGSGWGWLILERGHLKVQSTLNADTPCGLKGIKPLWALDVWEHAYYLDYQNRRVDYAMEVVNNAINWRFVSKNLDI